MNTPQNQTAGFDPNQTQTINRFSWGKFFQKHGLMIAGVVVVLLVIGLVKTVHDKNDLQARHDNVGQEIKKASGQLDEIMKKLEAAKTQIEATKAKVAEAPKPVVDETPKISGTFGVVIGTLFKLDQRAEAAEKSASAFDSCKHNGQPLNFCFVEVGKKTTEVVAVPKTVMNEAEATALATCFNDSLPKLDSGEKVGAFASNLSSRRYAGRTCITQ